MNEFGKALKHARKGCRLTLRALGEKIGKSITYISDIENGRKMPPGLQIVQQFEQALGITDGSLSILAEKVKALPKEITQQAKIKPLLSEALLRADRDLSEEGLKEAMKAIERIQKEEKNLGD